METRNTYEGKRAKTDQKRTHVDTTTLRSIYGSLVHTLEKNPDSIRFTTRGPHRCGAARQSDSDQGEKLHGCTCREKASEQQRSNNNQPSEQASSKNKSTKQKQRKADGGGGGDGPAACCRKSVVLDRPARASGQSILRTVDQSATE